MAPLHTIEHLGATYLRNSKIKYKIVYFEYMGCRTGFYLLLAGNYNSKDVLKLIKNMFLFISKYEGKIQGASPKECDNYLDQNLIIAKYEAKKYVGEVLKKIRNKNLNYPN